MARDRTSDAVELITRFADRTGVTSAHASKRYLWTDAFAVCTLLGLEHATHDKSYVEIALRLVDRVHHELGRHRPDDRRSGWLSGLSEAEGEAHPTRGGLRIGKPLPERAATEAFDAHLEWERDGQYFHYLTRWMLALDQVTRSTHRTAFNVWARELATTAHRAFTYGAPGARRMAWKLSIDLSRPLVASMGHHDPLDGHVTCTQLDATAAELHIAAGPSLALASSDFATMIDREGLVTSDPLGLGGLLVDACRLAQLEPVNRDLIASLLTAASIGLHHYVSEPDLRAPAHARLAFRELGLAIGLAGFSMLGDGIVRRLEAHPLARASLGELVRYVPLRNEIESFWLRAEHRRTSTWSEHADINDVMLATSLAPEGYLGLAWPRHASPHAAA
jgi:hypothetical protein